MGVLSFQHHVRNRATVIEVILKRSGLEGIYAAPKSETLNRADEQYAIVWRPHRAFEQTKDFLGETQ